MPFFSVTKPGSLELERFVAAQHGTPITYNGPLVPTPGFRLTRTLESLGYGSDVFAKAVSGLAAWAVYPAWLTLYPKPAPLRRGGVVALVTGISPVWTLSAVQIIAVKNAPRQFSFTVGTLPQHAVSGCERFCVFLDEQGRVWYELTALSKPRQPLVKLGAPVLRLVQARVAGDSVRALTTFCKSVAL